MGPKSIMLQKLRQFMGNGPCSLRELLSAAKCWALQPLIARQRKTLHTRVAALYRNYVSVNEIVEFLRLRPAEMLPYFFCDDYRQVPVLVEYDKGADLKFVIADGQRIYFPRGEADEVIVESSASH